MQPHVDEIAGGEIENGREVREVAGPIRPGGHEAGEIAESALAPDVEAPFVRVAGREFHDGKRERQVEEEPRTDPDDDRTGARRGGGSDPAQADAGDGVEENQIAEAENALGSVRRLDLGGGGCQVVAGLIPCGFGATNFS